MIKRVSLTVQLSEVPFNGQVFLNAGNTLSLRTPNSGFSLSANTSRHWISINRLSGPSAIAASETVAARYRNTAGTGISSSISVVPWATRIFDTHGAMVSNTYTVPVSGKYLISSKITTAGTTWTNESLFIHLYKNGSLDANLGWFKLASSSGSAAANGAAIVECIAGDDLTIRMGLSSGSTTLLTTAGYNEVYIARVGN